jgi:hypothetical protein
MASTGKSEIMAGVFAAASNDFMTECHDLEEEQGHGEDEVVASDEEQESTDLVGDGPARRKRGNYRGKKKLFYFQRTVELKEAELAAVGQALGPIEFAKRQQAILKALLSKTSNLSPVLINTEKCTSAQICTAFESYLAISGRIARKRCANAGRWTPDTYRASSVQHLQQLGE